MKTIDATHTPGPWKYHLGRGANPRFHVQDSGGYQIASTTELVRHSQAWEENAIREANARLIAAAPGILQALETLVARIRYYSALPADQRPGIEQWEYTEGSTDMEEAIKAIAKAKGEPAE